MNSMNVKVYKRLKNTHTNIKFAVYLPIESGPEHTTSNTSKFNSTIATLKQVFKDADLSQKEERKILDDLRNRSTAFSRIIAGKGVAFYIFYDLHIEMYSLPFSAGPSIYYELHHLHLEPLEEYFGSALTYWVLMLSSNGCHLFKGNGRMFKRVDDTMLQKDMVSALNLDEVNMAGLQTHATHEGGSKGSEGFHGQGGFKDMRKKYLLDYFRIIDARLKEHIDNRPEPIILVGVDYIQSLYKKASNNKHALHSKISIDPHSFSLPGLRSLVEPIAANAI